MKTISKILSVCGVCVLLTLAIYSSGNAQQKNQPVELNGDEIEFKAETNTFMARGNVSVMREDAIIYADQMEFNRATKDAYAVGHVILETDQGDIWADELSYNLTTGKGEFVNARLMAHPYYGYGQSIQKLGDAHYVMKDGYLTTSDYDEPGFRTTSKEIEMIVGDRATARQSAFKVGRVPLMYMPSYNHDLSDGRPRVRVTPGYSGEWGAYALTAWRYELNEYVNGRILLDYRERRDFASGINAEYVVPNMGQGVLRTYYMNERDIGDNHLWDERADPTIERERYKVELRHKWEIDEKTNFIGQYYKLSDNDILDDYFEDEFREDTNPNTYFLLTHALPKGTLSLRSDVRVNRFESKVERLPEINYNLNSQEIGESNFYYKNTTTLSNLVEKTPSPSDFKPRTLRFRTQQELSRPFKMSIFELRPYVGLKNIYYSDTTDVKDDGTLRSAFNAGVSASTKFFRVYDADDFWGMEINKLRHIITPSLSYAYQHDATHEDSIVNQFDSIDSIVRSNKVTLSLENKLQTKRNGSSVDLVRFIMSLPYFFNNTTAQTWGDWSFDLDFRPTDFLTMYVDATLDSEEIRFDDFNVDFYLNDPSEYSRWRLGVGKRWARNEDDQYTTHLEYKVNPKWRFSIFQRFDAASGELSEQEYSITRDLHSWEMNLIATNDSDEGSDIMLSFTMKAFPEANVSVSRSFKSKASGRLDQDL